MRIVRDILLYLLAFVLLVLVPLLEVSGIVNQTLRSRSTYYQVMMDAQFQQTQWDEIRTKLEEHARASGISADVLLDNIDADSFRLYQWRQWSAMFDLIEGGNAAPQAPLDWSALDAAVMADMRARAGEDSGPLDAAQLNQAAQTSGGVRRIVEEALAPVDVSALTASGQLGPLRDSAKTVRWVAVAALTALMIVELLMLLLLRRHRMHIFWWNGSVLIVDSLVLGALAKWALATRLPERLVQGLPSPSLALSTVLRDALQSLFYIQIGTLIIGLLLMILYLVYRRSYRV